MSLYSPRSQNSNHGTKGSSAGTSASAAVAVLFFVYHYWESRLGKTGKSNGKQTSLFWRKVFSKPGILMDRIRESLAISPSIASPSATERSNGDGDGASDGAGDDGARQEIRNNHRIIQSVLNFWFGQHAPEKSQKMLWMIAASSREHREKVDADIVTRFEPLLKELSSLDNRDSERWQQWCVDPDGIYGAHGKIAAIIVLDQFSRHILRHYGPNTNHLPSKECLDRLALQTAELLVKEHSAELDCGMIPVPMRVFALMPYRHASTMESVKYVQQTVEEMAALEEQNEAMVGRFRKATNRRLAVLQDEQRRTGKTDANKNGSSNTDGSDHRKVFSDVDILETFPFEADMTPALQHPIHKTMVQFLADRGIHPVNGSGGGKNKTQQISTKSSQKAAVIVSLSGGVDSMVIASVLAHLKRSCGYDHLTILAVHIDYANRPESGAEADYVRRYCEEQVHNAIEFCCRRIGEVTRGITARDDYERIAREIRYDSYRDAVARAKDVMGLKSKEERRKNIVGVMLGHHRGDLRENVLSNAHKGCGPLDLSGMTAVSKNDGITVYRPLLPLEKSLVFDYAHKFGVPYYKDTTPHWSTRGKLRNKLLPLLEEIYGDGSMNNLSNLAVESDECRALMNKSMIEPFLNSIVRKPMGIIMDTAAWKDQPLFFWKVVLREALHSVGLGMFSDKSVIEFLKRIQTKKLKAAWLQCRKDYGVYLREDGKVFVLYKSSFPWSKKDGYGVDGEALAFQIDRMVGPWKVRAEIVSETSSEDSSQPSNSFLEKRAVISMEAFMNGNIEYFLSAPTSYDKESGDFIPRPLVFRQFSKADRPRAWKSCDLRIQSTLPVLGNEKEMVGNGSEVNSQTETSPERLIRVTITLCGQEEDE
mmetsp:Transcript_14554/g.40436  ORF Transcript_14554/g.40436 Transcript_14554/m.40436 type:complete len:877 (-) Transcript_14554:182-2812(-)|eukprot:CAMPEP_0172357206 /NCGR_PEP_ID=MMETSP1060-20121228/1580_1 /TAXON_ID=37318 /ORGANISM="Pseudo-nitzschia pungens, Strain cf. cingulata" /LENGTH=876 /DNA_ID=CAMNT_0013077753 /DNA_START=81 /DNA_END=2711 /DNA_ORIENTATION=-